MSERNKSPEHSFLWPLDKIAKFIGELIFGKSK